MATYWIYNEQNIKIGMLQNLFSVIWSPRYYESGTAEIHAMATDENREFLQIGNRIVFQERHEVLFIDYIYIDESTNGGDITVRGYLDNIGDRVNTQTARITRVSQLLDIIRKNKRDLDISVPDFVGEDISIPETETTWQNIRETFKEMGKKYGFGFRTIFTPKNIPSESPNVFEIYIKGKNELVKFSEELGNISDQTMLEDRSELCNFAYVAGAGEGEERQVLELDFTSGESRKELYVDARDISDVRYIETGDDFYEEPIPKDEYTQMLKNRGLEVLAEQTGGMTFEANLQTSSDLFELGKDYELGDIVKVISKRFGFVKWFRIAGLDYVEEKTATVSAILEEVTEVKEEWLKELSL